MRFARRRANPRRPPRSRPVSAAGSIRQKPESTMNVVDRDALEHQGAPGQLQRLRQAARGPAPGDLHERVVQHHVERRGAAQAVQEGQPQGGGVGRAGRSHPPRVSAAAKRRLSGLHRVRGRRRTWW